MTTAVSPLAPTDVPDMPVIAGVKLATAAAGIRYKGRTDVLLAVMEKGTTVAGVFTRSKCPSAPVEWCRAKLPAGKARALVVNSGNANAFTGKTGRQATALTASIAAKALGCSPNDVFLASTGVIGEPLDATKFNGVLGTLAEQAVPGEWLNAAKAIMTTDTFAKVATATVKLGKARVTINGMAKGAGMIAPDMATMLAFVFTDAPITAGALQSLLKSGVEDTFNAVTIDGDTSTSDTLLAFATGAAAAHGAPKISRAGDPRLKAFTKAFRAVLADLAEQVARDGEGARKLVEIIVDGATTKASARKIAMSVANSPLVKTAIAGEDANWGRVVMAVGKAGEPANRDKLSISFNGR
jgi:glutamate N-acetyltransferase / amino-acid N-acetyltransferase